MVVTKLASSAYVRAARRYCCWRLARSLMNDCASARRPLRRCAWKLGSAMAARIPTIATAIMTSINVNPRAFFMGKFMASLPRSPTIKEAGPARQRARQAAGIGRRAAAGRGPSGGPGEPFGEREIHVLVDPLEL